MLITLLEALSRLLLSVGDSITYEWLQNVEAWKVVNGLVIMNPILSLSSFLP